jgi:hypothetical protein
MGFFVIRFSCVLALPPGDTRLYLVGIDGQLSAQDFFTILVSWPPSQATQDNTKGEA